jgi:hypothetical protein
MSVDVSEELVTSIFSVKNKPENKAGSKQTQATLTFNGLQAFISKKAEHFIYH